MHSELRSALDALYDALPESLRPASVSGCSCCITDQELAVLGAVPRRQVPPEALRSYGSSALLTVGTPEDVAYFWPRLIELELQGTLHVGIEILWRKPGLAAEHWSDAEHEAVTAFATAVSGTFATFAWESDALDEWVCGLAQYVDDLAPFLEPLLTASVPAATNLVTWYDRVRHAVDRDSLPQNAFWEDVPEQVGRLMAWMRAPRTLAAIDLAYTRRDGYNLGQDLAAT